jgi:hypothetical protein
MMCQKVFRVCFNGLLVVILSSVILGCQTSPAGLSRERGATVGIGSILVLPFQTATAIREGTKTVRCFECDFFVQTGSIQPGADDFMNDAVVSHLRRQFGYETIPFWTAQGVSSQMLSQDLRGADKRLLVQMGRSLGGDAVLTGTIYRFEDRVGTAMSVTRPASVAFAMELVRVSDGKTIWSRPYDETQQSLDENLFKLSSFLKQKGRWLTAEELASFGLKKIMRTFPVRGSNSAGF